MSNRMNPHALHPVQRWAEAFRDGQRFTSAKHNVFTDGQAATLHSHTIAWRDDAGLVWLSMCGWGTPTTRDRLNHVVRAFGLPGAGFRQWRCGQWFNDREIGLRERIPLCGPMTQLALDFERAERAGQTERTLRDAA